MRQYNNIMNTDNIIQLYKDYKRVGGFGVFSVDDLIGKGINVNDIPKLLSQEQKLIELYCMTYDKAITLDILETYLGRKRINIYTRLNYRLKNMLQLMKNIKNVDVYTYFMKNNSIHGYKTRAYWAESELMKKELSYT